MIKWSFDPDAVFKRLNAYLVRLDDVNEIIVAAYDFLKLENIEIGGVKGHHLSERIQSVYDEFHTLYSACIVNHSNSLEPSNNQFKTLKKTFQRKITVLERKLSQILMETFVNCNSAESNMKTIEMFGGLLERPIIKQQISNYIDNVIEIIQSDINDVHHLLNDSASDKQIKVNIAVGSSHF